MLMCHHLDNVVPYVQEDSRRMILFRDLFTKESHFKLFYSTATTCAVQRVQVMSLVFFY